VITAIVAIALGAIIVATIVLFALDRGPSPAEIAEAYELAWDRLDFDALWAMSGRELRDGLDRRAYAAAKRAAYAAQPGLGGLVERVDLAGVDVGIAYAQVRTRVSLRGGEVVHNDLLLARRGSAWVVTGYSLAPGPARPA
jgi:hypothetical protein